MNFLKNNDLLQAIKLLKYTELVLGQELDIKDFLLNKLKGITYNNLSCYYKQKNKPQVALKYL